MSTKRTSSAFVTSVILHIIIALVAGLDFLSQTQEFKNLIGVDILQPSKPRTPPRPPHIVKPPIQPTVREHSPVTEELVPAAKREVITSPLRPGVQPQVAQDIAHQVLKIAASIQSNVPTVVATNTPVPRPVTQIESLTSDAPDALNFPLQSKAAFVRRLAPRVVVSRALVCNTPSARHASPDSPWSRALALRARQNF